MRRKRNYYDVLGVEKTSSDKEIKLAYRRLSKNKHPDTGGSDEDFINLKKAYDTLSDAKRRKDYDSFGHITDDETSYKEARSLLCTVLKAVVLGLQNISFTNVIHSVTQSINSLNNSRVADIEECKATINRISEFNGRISSDDDNIDVKNVFSEELNNINSRLESAKHAGSVIEVALAILSKYTYRTEDVKKNYSLHEINNMSLSEAIKLMNDQQEVL